MSSDQESCELLRGPAGSSEIYGAVGWLELAALVSACLSAAFPEPAGCFIRGRGDKRSLREQQRRLREETPRFGEAIRGAIVVMERCWALHAERTGSRWRRLRLDVVIELANSQPTRGGRSLRPDRLVSSPAVCQVRLIAFSATLFTSYCTEPATSAEKHSPLYPAATSSSSLFHGDMLGATPSPPVNMWNSNIHSKYLFDYAEVMMTIPTFLDAFFGRGRVVEWESGDTMLRKKCVRSIRRRRRRSVSAAVVLCVCVGGIPLN